MATRMNLEIIIPSEVDKYHIISLIHRNLKKMGGFMNEIIGVPIMAAVNEFD